MFRLSLKKILDAIHIKCQCEAQRLIQRIALGCGDDVANVEREHIHAETATNSEVGAITLVL